MCTKPLGNLTLLKEDMRKKGWTITSFVFIFKEREYIVLVKRFVERKPKNEYALVELKFMRADDIDNTLTCEANSVKLFADARTIREYFDIEYGDHLGDAINNLYNHLGRSIPTEFALPGTDGEMTARVAELSRSDAEDPMKIHITNVRRNPAGKHRSPYNADKTRLLYADIFRDFEDDDTISFCYSDDPKKENDRSTILKMFGSRDV